MLVDCSIVGSSATSSCPLLSSTRAGVVALSEGKTSWFSTSMSVDSWTVGGGSSRRRINSTMCTGFWLGYKGGVKGRGGGGGRVSTTCNLVEGEVVGRIIVWTTKPGLGEDGN